MFKKDYYIIADVSTVNKPYDGFLQCKTVSAYKRKQARKIAPYEFFKDLQEFDYYVKFKIKKVMKISVKPTLLQKIIIFIVSKFKRKNRFEITV